MNNPFIFKVLDASISHMTEEDGKVLRNEIMYGDAPLYELDERGWLVYVGEIEDNWPAPDMSEDFRRVMAIAKELDCDYVRFQRDGRTYDELPVSEW